MFLLLNLAAVLWLFPFTDPETKQLLNGVVSNAPIAAIIAITFGYLIGILLRLFSTEFPDGCSAAWLKIMKGIRGKQVGLYATDKFPYIGWIEVVCEHYYQAAKAQDFYQKVWKSNKMERRNKQFFNYCKVLINSHDERASREIYIAESLTRYISGMFYALGLASIAILFTVILQRILYGQAMVGLVMLLIAYLFSILVIVSRFRSIRIKEVETVFVASLKNQEIFLKKNVESTD